MTVAKKAAKQVLVPASKAKPETKLVDLKLVTKDRFYPYSAHTDTGSNSAFEKKHGLVTVADLCKVERDDLYDSDHRHLYIAAARAAKVSFKPEAVSRSVDIDGALYAEINEACKASGTKIDTLLQSVVNDALSGSNPRVKELLADAKANKAKALRDQAAKALAAAEALEGAA
jgi:hypothetical protein